MLGMARWITLLGVSRPQGEVIGPRLTHWSIGASEDGGNGVGMTLGVGAVVKWPVNGGPTPWVYRSKVGAIVKTCITPFFGLRFPPL